jgi:hypothetical protein
MEMIALGWEFLKSLQWNLAGWTGHFGGINNRKLPQRGWTFQIAKNLFKRTEHPRNTPTRFAVGLQDLKKWPLSMKSRPFAGLLAPFGEREHAGGPHSLPGDPNFPGNLSDPKIADIDNISCRLHWH